MFDIIGDVHGCYEEFYQLTEKLGYAWEGGIPLHDERQLVFVGDITDRGASSIKMIELVWELVINKQLAYYSPGNHCNKLYRFLLGRKVQISHGLETTVAEYKSLSPMQQEAIRNKMIQLYEQSPLYHRLDHDKLLTCHAGIREDYIGQHHSSVQRFVLYGDITGEKHPDGSPVRRDWSKKYSGKRWVIYGHTPVKKPRTINKTINIDTGCVFGGNLTALRYPEMDFVSVPSTMPYVEEKFKTFDS